MSNECVKPKASKPATRYPFWMIRFGLCISDIVKVLSNFGPFIFVELSRVLTDRRTEGPLNGWIADTLTVNFLAFLDEFYIDFDTRYIVKSQASHKSFKWMRLSPHKHSFSFHNYQRCSIPSLSCTPLRVTPTMSFGSKLRSRMSFIQEPRDTGYKEQWNYLWVELMSSFRLPEAGSDHPPKWLARGREVDARDFFSECFG